MKKAKILSFATSLSLGWIAWYGKGSVLFAGILTVLFYFSLPREVESVYWKERNKFFNLVSDHWNALIIGAFGWIATHMLAQNYWYLAPLFPLVIIMLVITTFQKDTNDEDFSKYTFLMLLICALLLIFSGYSGFYIFFYPEISLDSVQLSFIFLIPLIFGWAVREKPPSTKKEHEFILLIVLLSVIAVGVSKPLGEVLSLPSGYLSVIIIGIASLLSAFLMASSATIKPANIKRFSYRTLVFSLVYSVFLDGGIALVSILIIVALILVGTGQFRSTLMETIRVYPFLFFLTIGIATMMCYISHFSMLLTFLLVSGDTLLSLVIVPFYTKHLQQKKLARERPSKIKEALSIQTKDTDGLTPKEQSEDGLENIAPLDYDNTFESLFRDDEKSSGEG